MEKPTDNNADQGDRFVSADAARYMCLQSAEGRGRLLFVCYNLALLLLWGLHELQHPLDEKPKASDGKF